MSDWDYTADDTSFDDPLPEELGKEYDYLPEEPPVDESGNLLPLNPDEQPTELDPDELRRETEKEIWGTPPDAKSKSFLDQISTFPTYVQNLLAARFTDGKGNIDWGKVATSGAGLVGAYNAYKQAESSNRPVGYQGSIPSYTAVQGRAAEPVAGSRPGAGHQYFTGVKFAPAAGLPAAKAAIDAQVAALNKLNTGSTQARTAAPEKTTDTWTRPDGTPLIDLPAPVPEELTTPGGLTWKQLLGPAGAIGGIGAPSNSSNKSSMTPDDFMKSDDYKKYQADSANQIGTMDTYNSPYFGMQSSGSYGRGLDKAYEIARNNQSLAPSPTQPVIEAAHGGIMGLARGGKPTHPRGTYLRGDTDGMADKIPGTIDGVQPARLAHGEFVIPADVVSHLGNGNSDAGARQLYKMMDRIRMARTGSEKQGKEINPSKFMPGGLASYAMGGNVARFNEGTEVKKPAIPATATGTESNLSNFAGPYVTELMGKAQALTNAALETPQFYQGELTAGPSALQNQAYGYAANLSTPTSIGTAANTAGNIATNLSKTAAYSPTTFGTDFTAPSAYQASNIKNQFTAPKDYQAAGSTFDTTQAQQYMNPYLQASLNPQLDEARRQSQITQAQNAAKMSSAGAFGGGRQAIMDAENQRNLGTNLANITGQGYNTAFGQAQQQFNADQQRKIQEAQFGASQGMNAAQLQAQYGMTAEQANEASKQFGAQQGMTGAQLAAQYGLAGRTAGEQAKQFGAQYGLSAQNAGLAAAQAQGQLGSMQNQVGLANLGMMANLGGTQQQIEQAGLAAAKAQFDEQKADPYKQLQFQQSMLQGLPLAAQSYNTTTNPYSAAAAGATGTSDLFNAIFKP